MGEVKGEHLFVNVGASQARRRLKHFGHGVRKVQSAGKNQAVVIHTATGRHLEESEAKFADVGFSHNEHDMSEPIGNLRNLGEASAPWLREAGVLTIADLSRLGPVAAYRIVKQRHPQVTLNLLWSLAAGLGGKDWRDLGEEEKRELLNELREDT